MGADAYPGLEAGARVRDDSIWLELCCEKVCQCETTPGKGSCEFSDACPVPANPDSSGFPDAVITTAVSRREDTLPQLRALGPFVSFARRL